MGTPSHQQLGLESVAVLKVFKVIKSNHQKWQLTQLKLKGSAISTIGMARSNLTKKTTVEYGQTDDVEKKFCKFDEVVSLVQQAVKEPEHTGNYHDYVELCKLYDKNENGTMMLAELKTFLSLMGDEIPKEDCAF